MYGNYYDAGHGGNLGKVRDRVDDILADTRDAVSDISSDGSVYKKVSKGMGDRLKDVGVGGVKKYLEKAYEPFVPTDTPSYSEFMADTPGRIQSAISAKQTAYQAGQADRMRDFQDILQETKAYAYGGDSYSPVTNPGKGTQAPKKNKGAAESELKALTLPKFKNSAPEKSLAAYKEQFGNRLQQGEYDALVEAGYKPKDINRQLEKYMKAGGKLGNSVFDTLGYDLVDAAPGVGPYRSNDRGKLIVPQEQDETLLNLFSNSKQGRGPLAPIGDIKSGKNFDPADKRAAMDAGYTRGEVNKFRAENAKKPGDFMRGNSWGKADNERALAGGFSQEQIDKWVNNRYGGDNADDPGDFMRGNDFGASDRQRARAAGFTNAEINAWLAKNGY